MPAIVKPSRSLRKYFSRVQELLKEMVVEGIAAERALQPLISDPSEQARSREKSIHGEQLAMATRRLQVLETLAPPPEAQHIHAAYMKAFTFAVEARAQSFQGNDFRASAAHQIASDALGSTTEMWPLLGLP